MLKHCHFIFIIMVNISRAVCSMTSIKIALMSRILTDGEQCEIIGGKTQVRRNVQVMIEFVFFAIDKAWYLCHLMLSNEILSTFLRKQRAN